MADFIDDEDQFAWIRRDLYVAAVCDVLDALGYREQAMHQRIRPLDPKNCTIVGRARTVRWMEVDYVEEQDPYGAEIEFIDSLRPGDVAVHSTDHGGTNAPWGELMSTVAKMHGATGCICDSMIRDCEKIIALGISGLQPRHPAVGQHGPRQGDGLRRPHSLRRRARAARRPGVRRFRRRGDRARGTGRSKCSIAPPTRWARRRLPAKSCWKARRFEKSLTSTGCCKEQLP